MMAMILKISHAKKEKRKWKMDFSKIRDCNGILAGEIISLKKIRR